MHKILFASTNINKLDRIKKFMNRADIEWLSLSDINLNIPEPEEIGKTGVENAEIKAKYYYERLIEKLPVLTQDDTINLFGVNKEENPGVSIKEPVIKKYGEFTDENAYKYYRELAKKYGGEIPIQFNYGHAVAWESGIVSGASILGGRLTSKISNKRTPGYFLADMLLVSVNGQWRYYNDLSEAELIEQDSDLRRSIKNLLDKII